MKQLFKLLLFTILLSGGLAVHAQETPPPNLKSVNAQLYIHLPDSAIWHQKGAPYGWERLARYKDISPPNLSGYVLKSKLFSISNNNIIGDTINYTARIFAYPSLQTAGIITASPSSSAGSSVITTYGSVVSEVISPTGLIQSISLDDPDAGNPIAIKNENNQGMRFLSPPDYIVGNYVATTAELDSVANSTGSLIPTNGLQTISGTPDSIGLGGTATQAINIDALGYGINLLSENGDNSSRLTVIGGLTIGVSQNAGDTYFLGAQSDPTQQPGAAIGYQTLGANQSFININKHSMSIYDTLHRVGLVDSLRHNIVSGLQLAEIQDVDSIALAKADSVFTSGIGAALINGATNTLTAPTIFDAGTGNIFEVIAGTSPNLSSLIVSPGGAGINDQVSSTVGYGVSAVTSGAFKGANLGYENPSNSADISMLQIDESNMYIKDTHRSTGLKYINNYGVNFTSRSLIDRGFADSAYLNAAGAAGSLAAKQDTLGSAYNILHFTGASYNGSTDNTAALAQFKSAYGKSKTLYFAQNAAGNAVYYFTTQPVFDGYTISADPGVILSVPTTDITSWKNVNFISSVKMMYRDKVTTALQQQNSRLQEIMPIVSGISRDEGFGQLTSLDCTTLSSFTYNTSTDTKTTSNAPTLSTLAATFSSGIVPASAVDDSLTYMTSEITPTVGYMYNAAFTATANATGGYGGVMAYSSGEWVFFQAGQSGYKITSKKTGVAATYTYLPSTYSPAYLLQGTATVPIISFRIVSPKVIEFYVNGSLIKSYTLASVISSAGYGVNRTINNAGTQTATTVTYGNVVKKSIAKKLNLGFFGNSIMFGAGSSISTPAMTALTLKGIAGIYDVTYKNYAHSGDKASDVLDSLNAHSVAAYDYCLVDIGTNDIQQGTTVGSLSTSMRAIIAKIRADGSTPIIGIPPMFTDSTQTHTGPPTVNYAKGGLLRATIMKICADSSVMVADVISDLGGIDNLAVQLRDNIHPQALYQATIGRSFAKAILNSSQKSESVLTANQLVYGSTANDGTQAQSSNLTVDPVNSWLRVGVNAPTNANVAALTHQGTGTNAGLGLERQANPVVYQAFRYNGTATAKTQVKSQDILSSWSVWGYGASGYNSNPSALIQFRAQTDFNTTNKGTAIDFMTSPNTAVPIRRMWINRTGDIYLSSDTTLKNNYKLFVDPESGRSASAVFNASSSVPFIIRYQTDTTKSLTITPSSTGILMDGTAPLNINTTNNQTVKFGTGTFTVGNFSTNGGLLYTNASGLFQQSGAITGLIKGNGTSAPTVATANTDYLPVTSPVMVTPTLGAASATSINKVAITAPATSATFTLLNGKTFTVNNTMVLAGTDGSTYTFPGASTNIVGNPNGALNILASTQTTLVAGTKALSITGVTTGSHAQVSMVSQSGTVTTTQVYEAVCTAGTVTINAVTNAGTNTLNTLDTSTLNVFVTN